MYVDPCIIVQFIKKKSNKMQQCTKILLFHIYMKLNMLRATHRPSSGVYNCIGSLWLFIRGRLLDVQLVDVVTHTVPHNVHQLHVQQPSTYKKPEATSAVLGS
jgi:hypothetical protein